jgi:hypothetical protein
MHTPRTQNAAGRRRLAGSQNNGNGLHAQDSDEDWSARSEIAPHRDPAARRRGGLRALRQFLAGLDIVRMLAIRLEDPAWPTPGEVSRARRALAALRVRAQDRFDLEGTA